MESDDPHFEPSGHRLLRVDTARRRSSRETTAIREGLAVL